MTTMQKRYKSLDKRFIYTPLARLKLLFYRLRGRSWIEYYADKLDAGARRKGAKVLDDAYLAGGLEHLAFLQRHGLSPTTRFLDYGCGWLRTGRQVMTIIPPAQYVGLDISGERIAVGQRKLAAEGIPAGSYRTHVVRDCLLNEVSDLTFDLAWANSVFSHMPRNDIATTLRSMKSRLAADGAFIFSFVRIDRVVPQSEKTWAYSMDEMRQMCADAGLRFEPLDDWTYTTQQMVRATVA
jgi:cyclopropane fatty-acyl-phospholipid synthase-like methyltransferase